MAAPPGSHSTLELACEPSAPRCARAHTRDVLPRWGLPAGLVDDALVIVSELATNAVRHTGVGPQPRVLTCALGLWVAGGGLRVSMTDENPWPPVVRPESADAETGRGLQLIAALSGGAWGYRPTDGRPGKTVFAWLRLPPGAPVCGTRARTDA